MWHLVGVNILSKLKLSSFNSFEAMNNMNEHLWLLSFVTISVFEFPSHIFLILFFFSSSQSFFNTNYFHLEIFLILKFLITNLLCQVVLLLDNILKLHPAIFFSRFPFSCTWPSLFTERSSVCSASFVLVIKLDGIRPVDNRPSTN